MYKFIAWMRLGYDSTYCRFITCHIFKYIITLDITFDIVINFIRVFIYLFPITFTFPIYISRSQSDSSLVSLVR